MISPCMMTRMQVGHQLMTCYTSLHTYIYNILYYTYTSYSSIGSSIAAMRMAQAGKMSVCVTSSHCQGDRCMQPTCFDENVWGGFRKPLVSSATLQVVQLVSTWSRPVSQNMSANTKLKYLLCIFATNTCSEHVTRRCRLSSAV